MEKDHMSIMMNTAGAYPTGYNRGHEQKTYGERPKGNPGHKDERHDRK